MKRNLSRMLCLVMVLLFAVAPLSACSGDGPLTIAQDGSSSYLIVYENGNRDAADAAELLAEELEDLTEAVLEVTDDRTEHDPSVPEIRVGRTNRGLNYSLQRTVRYGGYVIAREGQDIYILGGGEDALKRACEDFCYEVMDADNRVSGVGELLVADAKYPVSTVTLNGRALTDYTVFLPERAPAYLKDSFACADAQLTALSGYMLTQDTYTEASEVSGPALVLLSDDSLGEGEYKIEDKGGDLFHLSAGSQEAAMAMAIAFTGCLLDAKAENMVLTLESRGGKAGENPLVPYGDADVRLMTFNVYATTAAHKSYMTYASASLYAYAPDFACMQEFPSDGSTSKQVVNDMKEAGYALAGGTFTEVSPFAVEKAEEDANYDRFASVGGQSYTPIFYRADRWEVVEDGSYLFYWKHRYHMTNTKSLSYGVFKNKETEELVLVLSTHFPLMASGYVGNGDSYMTYSGTDAVEGANWRRGAASEILKEVDAMRAKYPGILTAVGGDLNAKVNETSLKNMEDHAVLSNATVMADADKKTLGTSFHDYGKAPSDSGLPIDHWYISEDVATVLRHRIVKDILTVKGSDHCPVVVDIARK